MSEVNYFYRYGNYFSTATLMIESRILKRNLMNVNSEMRKTKRIGANVFLFCGRSGFPEISFCQFRVGCSKTEKRRFLDSELLVINLIMLLCTRLFVAKRRQIFYKSKFVPPFAAKVCTYTHADL